MILEADILVVGGGLGGIAAALAACRAGRSVVLTEETDWIGGQLTSQAVPPDEHPWVEQFGTTASYRRLRAEIRRYYRHWYPLRAEALALTDLNPGAGRVSKLCHEPRVALAVLEGMLAPHPAAGRLTVLTEHRPISAESDNDVVRSVTLEDLRDGTHRTLTARYVLDATETGELLHLAGVEHANGAEARAEFDEPHAPDEAQPLNQQGITVCFALSHHEGEDHTIDRPQDYGFWRTYQPSFWPGPLLGFQAPDPRTLEPVRGPSYRIRISIRSASRPTKVPMPVTRNCGASAASSPASCTTRAPSTPTSRSSTGRSTTTGSSRTSGRRPKHCARHGSCRCRCCTGCRPRRRERTAGPASRACGSART